jgi:hypothetical protein
MANGVAIDLDVMVYSCPPSTSTYMYNNMWTYRNHYKVDVEIRSTHAIMKVVLHAYSSKLATILYETGTL